MLDASEDPCHQQAVLRLVAASGAKLPRAELLAKIILVSQLDSVDPVTRAVAAELLQGVTRKVQSTQSCSRFILCRQLLLLLLVVVMTIIMISIYDYDDGGGEQ